MVYAWSKSSKVLLSTGGSGNCGIPQRKLASKCEFEDWDSGILEMFSQLVVA